MTVGSSGTLYAGYGSTSQLIRTTVTVLAEYTHTIVRTIQTTHTASTSMYSLTFRVRVTTPPAVWTKWNGVVADNVAHAAGASILSLVRACVRSACGGPVGLPLGSATHF